MDSAPEAQQMLYGAADASGIPATFAAAEYTIKSDFMRGQRKHMNWLSIFLVLFGPTAIFAYLSKMLSFSVHYKLPTDAKLAMFFCFLLVALFGLLAYVQHRNKAEGKGEPSWYKLLFFTSAIAWLSAYIIGNNTFNWYMRPYYDIANLKVYPYVDPTATNGVQLMDMGTVMFTNSSYLQFSKSMAFKYDKLYCVAPVGTGKETIASSYDFWAVGTDCCSGHAPDFSCGAYNKPAKGGIRIVDDEAMKYYALAVQQATSAYNIQAPHPIFFTWSEDPLEELNHFQDWGFKRYCLSVLIFFAMQFFIVVLGCVIFSKMSHL